MLKLRIITAVISLVVLLAVLFAAPPTFVELAMAIVVLGGAWEWSGLLGIKSLLIKVVYVFVIGALMAFLHVGAMDLSTVTLMTAFLWWLFAGLWVLVYPTTVPKALRWIGGVLVLVPLFLALVALYARGAELLLFLLLIVWSADIGAYFAGKAFGRVKLKPAISPGKTWEGVIGGLSLSMVVAASGALWFGEDLLTLVPFCLAIAIISIIGDLTVSIFKRSAGVKDSGRLFPGHGGILDRIDSVAAASPLFVLGLSRFGVL